MKHRYIDTFRDEAGELLNELETALIALEEAPESEEQVDLVFRLLHTIKGSGAMAGFQRTAALAHEVENLFDLVRSGTLRIEREVISVALRAKDLLRVKVAAECAGEPLDGAAAQVLLAEMHRLLPGHAAAAAPRQDEENAGPRQLYLIRFRPGRDILLRGIEPATLFAALAELGELQVVAHQHAIPALGHLESELCHLSWDLLLVSTAHKNALHDVFVFVEEDSELAINPVMPVADHATLTVLNEAAHLLRAEGELASERVVELLRGALAGEERAPQSGGVPQIAVEEQAASIRVRSERLDNLVNLIGELVTIQARLSATIGGRKDPALELIAEEVERLTWELRDEVLFIRMLPIGGTFGRLKRLVRDLAQELGKEVELVTVGAETELDKTVIERLQNPLVHLIRNCLDHGIEPPLLRGQLGKPASGRITVSAEHVGAQVVLTVSDDGRGLQRERLLHKAQELGLVDSDTLSDKELFQLIFSAGFSTAQEVTSISGRGVGMDVVRRAIEGLRGSIEVSSTPGHGTVFTLRLPLTLAIIDGLLVTLGGERYVLPLAVVEECVELTRADVARHHGRQVLNLRGEIVPYLRLREYFAVDGTVPRIEQIVITRIDGQRVGLVVDKVIGSHQTVIKGMGRLFQDLGEYSGATILGDGQVALILDVQQVLKSFAETETLATAS